ncbi:hypothetical protein HRJ34_15075 [Rhizorhabdus wittichii]|uniref:Uncharacterized protein n=1 Tax=Rhizorhabdus wittichii TaxID=160791 RepID=A0A975HBZ1_9SPHN|nr:hypothetical protein [Rhizorhabdus wittichii]QTH19693.1 hypothetical protein HRJ34_15075 [Rhizorhabdus wittichii]
MTRRCANCFNADGIVRMWGTVLWCRPCAAGAGAVGRRALVRHDHVNDPEAFSPEVLKQIACGPIMDGNALYLPAGKISMAEAKAREASQIVGDEPST